MVWTMGGCGVDHGWVWCGPWVGVVWTMGGCVVCGPWVGVWCGPWVCKKRVQQLSPVWRLTFVLTSGCDPSSGPLVIWSLT